jgi:hypothetical protein
MIRKIFYISSLLFFILTSCISDPLDIDVSNVKVQHDYVDLDSLIYLSNAQLITCLKKINSGEVLSYELEHCIGIGPLNDSSTKKSLKLFIEDPYISRVERKIDNTLRPFFTVYKSDIDDAFRHLKYYFPKGNMPKSIYFMNSLYASSVFCTENEIGVGLERYLGEKSDVIEELPTQEFFQWMKEGMNKDFLVRDVLTTWIFTHYFQPAEGTLVEQMIHWGKVCYLLEACLPIYDKHIVLRYTKSDYDWATKNEYQAWKYLVSQELVFSKNERDISNFLNEGPFTVGLPEKGPDRMGQYLGWKIVHSYIEQNENISLKQLLNTPYNKILQSYKID